MNRVTRFNGQKDKQAQFQWTKQIKICFNHSNSVTVECCPNPVCNEKHCVCMLIVGMFTLTLKFEELSKLLFANKSVLSKIVGLEVCYLLNIKSHKP